MTTTTAASAPTLSDQVASASQVAPSQRAHAATRRGVRTKLSAAVLVAATAFGFLFGFTAPSVSPVTPPAPPSAAAVSTPAP